MPIASRKASRSAFSPTTKRAFPQAHIQLRRPLDFAVVTDHSDLLGETRICGNDSLPEAIRSCVASFADSRDWVMCSSTGTSTRTSRLPATRSVARTGALCIEAGRKPWREIQDAAESHYDRTDRCAFTTFVGHEWTAMPGGGNAHRNVVFRNATVQGTTRPPSSRRPPRRASGRALEREC
ncbi:MAG: DUF3604 domain-containing protein, partial [Deltaproteobacteria bacterium]|nr:DUF3604 domain-containing protein [Deltaproteobacteria bacterium]